MSAQYKQTRLGFQLRQAVEKNFQTTGDVLKDDVLRTRALRAAQMLDKTVYSLGRKGEGVKSLRAYRDAARLYEEVTGKVYAAKA